MSNGYTEEWLRDYQAKHRGLKGKQMSEMVCADCGATAPRTGPTQKYCPECSKKRDLARQSKWAREHPLSDERRAANKIQKRKAQDARRAESVKRSVKTQLGPTWIAGSADLDKALH